MQILYVALFDGKLPLLVGLDKQAIDQFVSEANAAEQCEVVSVDELPLIDNYGFHCDWKEAGFLFPWLAECPQSAIDWNLSFVEEMRHD